MVDKSSSDVELIPASKVAPEEAKDVPEPVKENSESDGPVEAFTQFVDELLTDIAARLKDGNTPPTFFTLLVMCLPTILFSGMHWGFISFSAVVLNEEEDLSFTQIGSFVPIFGIFYTISTFGVGIVGEKISNKLLFVLGALIEASGMFLFTFFDSFLIKLAGFAIIGIGYSAITLIPYVQIRLYCGDNIQKYDR